MLFTNIRLNRPRSSINRKAISCTYMSVHGLADISHIEVHESSFLELLGIQSPIGVYGHLYASSYFGTTSFQLRSHFVPLTKTTIRVYKEPINR